MKVSIIIVNYNTTDLVINAVKSVIENTSGVDYEIILVDNNSDNSFDKSISNAFPTQNNIKLLKLKENIGFGRANNEGLKEATGEYVLFLNPDTLFINNALRIFVDFMDLNANVGACGGNLLDENLQPSFSYERWLPGIKWELDYISGELISKTLWGKNSKYNHTDSIIEVGYIVGADLMVRKSILDKIGAFSDRIFMYAEETDLCARIKKNGWKIVNIPSAQIQHLEGRSMDYAAPINKFKIQHTTKGRIIYYELNSSPLKKRVCLLLYRFYLNSRVFMHKGTVKGERYEYMRKCLNTELYAKS